MITTLHLIFTLFFFAQTECNDNLICTEDILDNDKCSHILLENYCLIDNKCYKTYETSENGCGICLPQKDQYNWSSNVNDDLECTLDEKDSNGNCIHTLKEGFCLIEHRCIPDKTEDINGCRICDTKNSVYEWTPYPSGTSCNDGLNCTKDDRCNGSGDCVGVEYSCDDNIECTLDICDGVGGCTNKVKNNYCFIDNQCIEDLMIKPDNECKYCNVLSSQNEWTNAIRDRKCNDGNSSTPFDYCDGKGSCIGYLYDPFLDAGITDSDIATNDTTVDSSDGTKIDREGCSCTTISF